MRAEADEAVERLREERERAEKITATLSAVSGGGTPDPHKFDEVAELSISISRLEQKRKAVVNEITDAINTLQDSRMRRVLLLFYIDGYSFERISEEMHYSIRHVKRLKADAIKFLSLNVTLPQ